MPTEKLKDLLNSSKNGDLSSVIERAKAMGALTEQICAALPEADRAGIVAANVRENQELVVICASPAWAARMRFETDRLIEAARAAGETVTVCRVRTSAG